MSVLDKNLRQALKKDLIRLSETKIPIVTVSASFREDLKATYGMTQNEWLPDVVFSRAHYSMAVGVAVQAWQKKIDHKKAWLVDPTNFVTAQEWSKIQLTEYIGKTLARNNFLKGLKDLVDKFGRSKLPILESITPPLLELTKNIHRPILSMHIAAGNILAANGKTVVQVVTDPHVREDYLTHADLPNMYFCVFDDKTKYDFVEMAFEMKKKVNPNHIIVTGPPIDPRIIAVRKNKRAWRSGMINLCITTGGLGTNKYEIRQLIRQILPEIKKHDCKLRLLIYAGTQFDIAQMVEKQAREFGVTIGYLDDEAAKLRIIQHPQIVNSNEMLIKYAFPWADGFVTKPSGDMAYDAAAAGCFILTLREWGVWEENIAEVFEQKGIARVANTDNIVTQMRALFSTENRSTSWVEDAMNNALSLEPLFLEGAKNILKTYQKIADR